jgi:hypothetical protein
MLKTPMAIVLVKTNIADESRDLFIRLQAGMPLNSQEKRDAWPGNFTEYILRIGGKPEIPRFPGHEFFSKVMKAKPTNRDEYRQLAAQIVMQYQTALNEARNALKHTGNLPNTTQWANVDGDVFHKVSSICRATLDISLEELDESELLSNSKVRAHLITAKAARVSQDFKLVLEELSKALFFSLEDAPGFGHIKVGRVNAEDALKLTAFGVSANDFLRLQEFLPMVSTFPTGTDWQFDVEGVLWKQSGFGHPGNWRDDVADFCTSTCLSVALSIQNAPPVPYPREFSTVYEYKVSANEDQVEVWEDLTEEDEHLTQIYSNDARPFRTHKRFLKKGESVVVSPHAQPFVSDDLSRAGEPIKRVRISFDHMMSGGIGALFGAGAERADFVNLADVTISCVPNGYLKNFFPVCQRPSGWKTLWRSGYNKPA